MVEVNKQCISKWIYIVGAIFTMGMSIYSFVTALNSYNYLSEIQGDYQDTITHWESLPLIDVKVVNPSENCPINYESGIVSNSRTALQTIGQFPGSLWWCDCALNGFQWTYTYYQYRCYCGNGKTDNNGTTYSI